MPGTKATLQSKTYVNGVLLGREPAPKKNESQQLLSESQQTSVPAQIRRRSQGIQLENQFNIKFAALEQKLNDLSSKVIETSRVLERITKEVNAFVTKGKERDLEVEKLSKVVSELQIQIKDLQGEEEVVEVEDVKEEELKGEDKKQ